MQLNFNILLCCKFVVDIDTFRLKHSKYSILESYFGELNYSAVINYLFLLLYNENAKFLELHTLIDLLYVSQNWGLGLRIICRPRFKQGFSFLVREFYFIAGGKLTPDTALWYFKGPMNAFMHWYVLLFVYELLNLSILCNWLLLDIKGWFWPITMLCTIQYSLNTLCLM